MKGTGAVLILLAFTLAGWFMLKEKKDRLSCLKELIEALGQLRGELELRSSALPQAMRQAAELSTGAGKELLTQALANLENLGEVSFSTIWQRAVGLCAWPLGPDERRELEALGAVLGRYELSFQLQALDSCTDYLKRSRERLRESLPAKRRILLGLSVSMGAFLVILLY